MYRYISKREEMARENREFQDERGRKLLLRGFEISVDETGDRNYELLAIVDEDEEYLLSTDTMGEVWVRGAGDGVIFDCRDCDDGPGDKEWMSYVQFADAALEQNCKVIKKIKIKEEDENE